MYTPSEIDEATKSCSCGHVVAGKKTIGGKRFSEYRASLYFRLETKRQRSLYKENQPDKDNDLPRVKAQAFCQKVQKPKRKTHIKELGSSAARKDAVSANAVGKDTRKCALAEQHTDSVVPPELLSRFPRALQEINRKIFSQNLLWVTVL